MGGGGGGGVGGGVACENGVSEFITQAKSPQDIK